MTTVQPRPAWTLAIMAALAITLVAIAARPLAIGWDQAMYLQAGDLLLRRYVPYVDIVDLNPPLIMYINAIPAAIARVIGQHPVPVFLVCMWAANAGSVFATRRLLAESLPATESRAADMMAFVLAVLPLRFMRWDAYGQREHLFICALFPYLIVRFRRWRGVPPSRGAAAVVGALAGLTVCLKPPFAPIALAPEIYWIVSRRNLRPLVTPETSAAAAFAAVYAAHFLFVPASMRAAFFGDVMPLVVRGYHVYDAGLRVMFVRQALLWIPAALSPLVLLVQRRPQEVAWDLAPPLVLMTVMSVLMFLAQGKGWMYQATPAIAGGAALFALLAAHVAPRTVGETTMIGPLRWIGVAIAAMIVTTVAAIPRTTARMLTEVTREPLAKTIATQTALGDPVLIVGTEVGTAYPLLAQLQRTPGSRFLFFFPIPMLYDGVSHDAATAFPYRGAGGVPMPRAEAKVWSDVTADLRARKPSLVLIERQQCAACPSGFDMADYLDRTSFTTTALAAYRRDGNVDGFDVYVKNAR